MFIKLYGQTLVLDIEMWIKCKEDLKKMEAIEVEVVVKVCEICKVKFDTIDQNHVKCLGCTMIEVLEL